MKLFIIIIIFFAFLGRIPVTLGDEIVEQDNNLDIAPRKVGDPPKDQCNKTVDIYEDISSPKLTLENSGKPLYCTYRFRSFKGTTSREWVLKIRFKKFKFGTLVNGTDCEGGYMQIVDGNAKMSSNMINRREVGIYCGEIEQAQIFISETSVVKITFQTDNYTEETYYSFDTRAEQQLEQNARYGKNPELYPNRRGQIVPGSYCNRVFKDCRLQTCYVQSPAYPGVYGRGLYCTYQLNTKLPYIKMYMQNEDFNVDGQRCENIMMCPIRPVSTSIANCPYDYIKVYDGKDGTSREIGTFCGLGKFPYSIIGSGNDLFVEFVTSRAGPLLNTGFHFNIGTWPGYVETVGDKRGECDWVFTNKHLKNNTEGVFLSIAHWYPSDTLCTYLLQGEENQVVRLHFPSLRINKVESAIVKGTEGKCGESLTIYDSDWPDNSRIIKTFCDSFSLTVEKRDFISTSNSLFITFQSKTGSYSGSSLYYWGHYDFFNNTKYGTPVVGSICDEEFFSWKMESGTLQSPPNTLIYKTAADSVLPQLNCRYKFVTDNRLYSRIILTVTKTNFKAHPSRKENCHGCWGEKVDKVMIYENDSVLLDERNRYRDDVATPLCICANVSAISERGEIPREYTVISETDTLFLHLAVDTAYSTANYFKGTTPLFEAKYEFTHNSLCGSPVLEASTDGELQFPATETASSTQMAASRVRCVWDIRVNENRDVALHFDKLKFISKHCDDGRLEIHLPSSTLKENPFIFVCGHNSSSLNNMRHISADLMRSPDAKQRRFLRIYFNGLTIPSKVTFNIIWTELLHLKFNQFPADE